MIDGVRHLNITPDELLFPGSTIVLETRSKLDKDQVKRAVGVRGAPGRLSLSRDQRRVAWRPDDSAEPGWYTFQVDGLTSASGKAVSNGGSVRFGLVHSKARIPKDVAVESMVRLRVHAHGVERLDPFAEPPRGKFVEMMKATDRPTGAPVPLAFDEDGRRLDPDQVLAAIAESRMKRYGKVHPTLAARLRSAKPNQRMSVAIWAHTEGDELQPDDKPTTWTKDLRWRNGLIERAIDVSRRAQHRLREEFADFKARWEYDGVAPVLYAKLTKAQIRRLEKSEAVSAIFAYDPRGFDDLDDSMDVANSDDAIVSGARGRGVRVAVWERGPDTTADLDIERQFDASGAMSSHSRLVHGIIKNTEDDAPHGHAPACTLFSANSYDLAALRWAVLDNGCSVINQSFHRTDEQTSDELSFDDIYKDWLILRFPFPTIIQAAGNGGSTEYVNHKGFNSIAVANHNDDASGLSSTSVSRNPDSPHADRELPEIAANGTSVTAVGVTDSGTSFASPAVAGIAAQIQGEDTVLTVWPEGCRAILLAGANRNVTDSTWWQDVSVGADAADGTGAVNAIESHRITENRQSRGNAAARRGWDIGTLDDNDFDGDGYGKFSYRVRVPSGIFGPTHVKVALAWDSKVKEVNIFGLTLPVASTLEQDLDLKVYNSHGALVAHSQSWDNSYEIAEFDGRPGEDYTIKVRRWSGTGWTWYGLAWTVTGGLLDFFRIRDMVFEGELDRG